MEIDLLLGSPDDACSGLDHDALLAWLQEKILPLLQHHPERLAQICYQIDLDESIFRSALKMDPFQGSRVLAEAFYRRELARREWKKRYSGKK